LDLSPKFQWIRDHPKCVLCFADSRYCNSSVSEDTPENSLVDPYALHLLQEQFKRVPTDKADFYQDAFIGDCEFGAACLNPRRQEQYKGYNAYRSAGDPTTAATCHKNCDYKHDRGRA